MKIHNKLLNQMIKVINEIKDGHYDELQLKGYLKNISRDEIMEELRCYGGTITNTDPNNHKKYLQYIKSIIRL